MLMMMLMSMPQGYGEGGAEVAAGTAEAGTQAATAGSPLLSFLPMIIIIVVFYLLFFLPQKKQEKKQRSMIDALVPGDEIVTIGGIYGNVVSVKDDTLVIESSADKTKIKIAKSSVSRCITVKEEEKK